MKLSYQWLQQWVDVQLSPAKVAEQLTTAGLEVESCLSVADIFTGVVVAEVQSVVSHPHADTLSVCTVSMGDGNLHTVVCGAKNVVPGMRVPYACVGAVLQKHQSEPKIIRSVSLRGVESAGMLCSAADLGMAEIADGLLVLPSDAPLGQDIRVYLQLDDTILDVQLTPNRGDCLSVLGVAREVGAINDLPVKAIPTAIISVQNNHSLPVDIQAQTACWYYTGRVLRHINNNAVTPCWMREALRRADVRCISPVVDVMNYVMLEIGQPLHAFDLTAIQQEIIVRFARTNETLTLLDGRQVTLQPHVLVIADQQKSLAIAGIMGGLESAVTPDTQAIFIESACFLPAAMQGRAREYGLQTDASYRFERGVDPELPLRALDRATELLLAITGGQAGPVTEVKVGRQHAIQPVSIQLSAQQLARTLGVVLPAEEIIGILQRLGMQVVTTATGWQIQPPSFRYDIQLAEDVIEEIARIHGYSRLPATPARFVISPPQPTCRLVAEDFAAVLVGRAYQEVITYSFIDPVLQTLCEPAQPALALTNPIASDLAVMRTSLWPGLLQVLQYNTHRQQERIRCFEHGLCFVEQAGSLQQQPRLAAVVTGTLFPEQWQPAPTADFYAVKSDVLALLTLSGRQHDFTITPATHAVLHPGQSAVVLYQQTTVVGYLGAIHPRILQALGIKSPMYGFELQLDSAITEFCLPQYRVLSRFPTVRRDLAIVVAESILVQQVEQIVRAVAKDWLQNFTVFDVYRGASIPSGAKSLAVGLTLQALDRTLTDIEVDNLIQQLLGVLAQQLRAELRE